MLPAASAATSGHVTLLKQKALTAILRRLDALLFGKLLGGACFPETHAVMLQLRADRQSAVYVQQSARTASVRAHAGIQVGVGMPGPERM